MTVINKRHVLVSCTFVWYEATLDGVENYNRTTKIILQALWPGPIDPILITGVVRDATDRAYLSGAPSDQTQKQSHIFL